MQTILNLLPDAVFITQLQENEPKSPKSPTRNSDRTRLNSQGSQTSQRSASSGSKFKTLFQNLAGHSLSDWILESAYLNSAPEEAKSNVRLQSSAQDVTANRKTVSAVRSQSFGRLVQNPAASPGSRSQASQIVQKVSNFFSLRVFR